MTSSVIRPAVADDAAALSELAERTFRDAFAHANTAKDMDLHCSRCFGPSRQAEEISDPAIRTLVVEECGSLIAFAQLHLHGEPPECVVGSPAAELRRFYVDRQWHGTGLAQELMDRVFATSSDDGVGVLWLGVWERNPRAIRFYHGYGFSEAGDQMFVLGTDKQRDLVMVLTLTAPEQLARQENGSASGSSS